MYLPRSRSSLPSASLALSSNNDLSLECVKLLENSITAMKGEVLMQIV